MENQLSARSKANTYTPIFSSTHPLAMQIKLAVSRLAITLGQPVDSEQLEAWAEELSCFQPTDLAAAFSQTAKTVTAWPTPAKVSSLILDWEYEQDLTWLLASLKIHGIEWKDRKADWKDGAYDPETATWARIDIPYVQAPQIPDHIKRALGAYGKGSQQDGLSKLAAHPKLKPGLYEKQSEMQRSEERIDNAFKAAWIKARLA